jgi:hypothetical protein
MTKSIRMMSLVISLGYCLLPILAMSQTCPPPTDAELKEDLNRWMLDTPAHTHMKCVTKKDQHGTSELCNEWDDRGTYLRPMCSKHASKDAKPPDGTAAPSSLSQRKEKFDKNKEAAKKCVAEHTVELTQAAGKLKIDLTPADYKRGEAGMSKAQLVPPAHWHDLPNYCQKVKTEGCSNFETGDIWIKDTRDQVNESRSVRGILAHEEIHVIMGGRLPELNEEPFVEALVKKLNDICY